MFVVIFLLPAALMLFDKLIIHTTIGFKGITGKQKVAYAGAGNVDPASEQKTADDDDFLNVSLGQVMADCHFRIRLSTDELKDKPDELELEAQELKREFSKMKQPVVVDVNNDSNGPADRQ